VSDFSVSAQKLLTRKLADTRFKEYYRVSEKDSAVLEGKYELYYKTHLIEKGQYKNGERSGIWSFYNLNNFLEFQYDFTRDSLLRIGGSKYYDRKKYIPPIFLGSPVIPYIHILRIIGYPSESFENKIKGKVILTLVISERGDIVKSFISESLDDQTDAIVLGTVKSFPSTWKWLPAKKEGKIVTGEYNISVIFDLD
jgi:hypothetical protein